MSSTLPSARGNGTDENTVSSATSTGPRGNPAYPATSARGLRGMIARFVEPTAKNPDLPRLRVLLAFPALLLILGVVLVSFSINGSSSGVMRIFVEGGPDSDLVSGSPQAIRSDEWNVQTVWAISQVQQGLPVTNETFPGGMDATVPQDLPRADWSVAFRPYLLGFNFLDVDHAIAWKWWVPGLALVAAAFCFLVTLMPRRPFTAALFSVGFFFSPLFQWWYLGTTLWPVVWGLAAMTLIVWATRAKTRVGTWVWAAIVAYLTVVMAMGIYVPFIIPVVLVVAFFAVGSIISTIRAGANARNGLTYYPADPAPGSVSGTLALAPARTARQTLRGFIPLIVAGAAGSAVTGYWLYTKITTVEAFLGTAYPGERLTPTGSSDEMTFISTIASSFTQALKVGGLLGQNSSEVSTFFLVGMFALPVVVWILVRQARRHAALPWLLISMAAAIVVLVAFMVLPGWDAISHLLLLDRTTPNRAKIGLGLASFVIVPLIISYLDAVRMRGSLTVSLLSAALFGGSQVAIAFALLAWEPQTLNAAPFWQLYVILGTLAVFFLARGYAGLAALAFLVLTGMGSATV
ncbi:MAG: hypothetical protein JWQ43_3039, partial [Glaciihabitans sp.]|nr:hypothetical protein [Glaciihabitans sp.]